MSFSKLPTQKSVLLLIATLGVVYPSVTPLAIAQLRRLPVTTEQLDDRTNPAGVDIGQSDQPNSRLISRGSMTADDSSYTLGPGDELNVRVRDAMEFDGNSYRIAGDGSIRLPMLGGVAAADLTVDQLEAKLIDLLKPYFVEPKVVVTIQTFKSQSALVVGAVQNPGIVALQSPTSLLEAISLAGGFRPDAKYRVRIARPLSRGHLPLESATTDRSGTYEVAEVDLDLVMSGELLDANILVRPGDLITVPEAGIVYVLGEVNRAGGFVLEQRKTVSVLQVLAMAEGWGATASPSKAAILRSVPGEKRRELPVDLKKIMRGEAEDLMLRPDDVLFIPGSNTKKILSGLLTASTGIVTSAAIWRLGRN